MLARWAGLSGELGQFMTARLMRNLDMMRAMPQCGGPAEFIELQLRWARDVWDDYMAEANRLMERSASMGGRLAGGPPEVAVAKPAPTKAGATLSA